MTANERLYLELRLKATLQKWKKRRGLQVSSQSEGMIFNEIRQLQEELHDLGNQYIKEMACSGIGAYVLREEKDRMFYELNQLMNHPSVKETLKKALYLDSNLDKVKKLSLELRKQISGLLKEYESHAQERRAS